MKKIIIATVVVFLLAGVSARAADSLPSVTPASGFWSFKIIGEWIGQKIMSIGGAGPELRYLGGRIHERNLEMQKMQAQGQTNSSLYIKALNERQDLIDQYNSLLSKENEKLAEDILNDIDPFGGSGEDFGSFIQKQLSDTRQQVLDAQKAGDNNKQTELLAKLKDLKQSYDDAVAVSGLWPSLEKQELDKVENILEGADKVNYAQAWAEKYREKIQSTSELAQYQSSKDLFGNATKAIDDLESTLKNIPLDKVDNKQLDNIFRESAQKLNNAAQAIAEKSRSEEAANRLPVETANNNANNQNPSQPSEQNQNQTQENPTQENQPQPAQQPTEAPKKTLKPIPSESVNTNPLQIHYYKTLHGKVGEPFSATPYYASGGLPPYHYQLATGVGFPPMGLILDTNGTLSGTPTVEGTSNFGVCVVDTAGKSVCGNTTMTVVEYKVTITSASCVGADRGQAEEGAKLGVITMSGTASGPVGTILESPLWVDRSSDFKADSWDNFFGNPWYDQAGDTKRQYAERTNNNPETTGWTVTDPEVGMVHGNAVAPITVGISGPKGSDYNGSVGNGSTDEASPFCY